MISVQDSEKTSFGRSSRCKVSLLFATKTVPDFRRVLNQETVEIGGEDYEREREIRVYMSEVTSV